MAFLLMLIALPLFADERSEELKSGYYYMYNLDFPAAHAAFDSWKRSHPDDPVGPVSNAAAYLFSEFNRLKILQLELFEDNDKFDSREKPLADAEIKKKFENELAAADELAARKLAASPTDRNAMFATVLANGLRGDYAAMIEKKNFAGLKYMKRSRGMAETLLTKYPDCYDAYLAVGVENYLLSLEPAPFRLILRIGGAQTDKETGLTKLKLTAEKGYYLAPYGRLLLAVAAMRDKDNSHAKELLTQLANEFPSNELLKKELARVATDRTPKAGD